MSKKKYLLKPTYTSYCQTCQIWLCEPFGTIVQVAHLSKLVHKAGNDSKIAKGGSEKCDVIVRDISEGFKIFNDIMNSDAWKKHFKESEALLGRAIKAFNNGDEAELQKIPKEQEDNNWRYLMEVWRGQGKNNRRNSRN